MRALLLFEQPFGDISKFAIKTRAAKAIRTHKRLAALRASLRNWHYHVSSSVRRHHHRPNPPPANLHGHRVEQFGDVAREQVERRREVEGDHRWFLMVVTSGASHPSFRNLATRLLLLLRDAENFFIASSASFSEAFSIAHDALRSHVDVKKEIFASMYPGIAIAKLSLNYPETPDG